MNDKSEYKCTHVWMPRYEDNTVRIEDNRIKLPVICKLCSTKAFIVFVKESVSSCTHVRGASHIER